MGRQKVYAPNKGIKKRGRIIFLDKEFKEIVIRMLNKPESRIEDLRENINKGLENMMNQSELKNTITEMKKTLEGINRLASTE